MKYILRFGALTLCIGLLISCLGCTPQPTVTPTSAPQSTSSLPQVVTQTQITNHTLAVDYNRFWVWSDLYDYLENPLASGKLAFNSDQQEYALLYEADGVTPITNWKQPLTADMLVVEYTADGREIRRIRITIENQPQETASHTSSRQPEAQSSSQPAASSAPGKPSSSGSQTSSVPNGSPVEITISGPDAKLLKKVADAFERKNPKIKVTVTQSSSLYTAAQLAGLQENNAAPQLVVMNQTEMLLAGRQGLLTCMPSLAENNQLVTGLNPVCVSKAGENNTCYGVPIGYSTYAFACNEEILYRSGVSLPTTFDELLSAARQVKDTLPGITPIGFSTNPADSNTLAREFAMLLFSFGGELFTPDGSASTFYSVEGTQTLQFYKKLQQEGLIQEQQSHTDFWNEKIAFSLICSESYSQTFGKRAKGNFSCLPFMMPGSQTAVSYMNLYSYCIPNGCSPQEQEAALEFIRFYYSDPSYSLNDCKTKDWIPALEEACNNDYYATEAWQIFRLAGESARTPAVLDCTETINRYLAQAVADALAGEDENAVLSKAKEKTDLRLQRTRKITDILE